MSYTELEDYKVGDLIVHNAGVQKSIEALRQNVNVVHDRNIQQYFHDGTGSDWTTTVLYPSLVKVDATKFQLTITTHGGPVMAWFHGSVRRATGTAFNIWMNIIRDNDPVDNTEPAFPIWANTWKPMSLWKPFPSLVPGTYTFAVYWQIQGGSVQASLQAASKPHFTVWEGY